MHNERFYLTTQDILDKEFKIEKIVVDNDIIIYLKGGNI